MVFIRMISIIIIAVSIWLAYFLKDVFSSKPLPNLPKNEYWGPSGQKHKSEDAIRPFKISFSNEMITDLKQRLENTRYAQPYEGTTAFEYGFNQHALKSFIDYWSKQYNFSERETYLNQYPHFKTLIQGLDTHFIHVKPEKSDKKVLPLLLLHGGQGSSVRDFYKIIPLLKEINDEYDFVFEVIAPSLPGFAFSQGPSRPGLSAPKIGFIMSNLMKKLGFKKYYVQGGDWGSVICMTMATFLPEEVLGFHTNFPFITTPSALVKMILGSLWPSMFVEKALIHKMYPVGRVFQEMIDETGYFHMQVTKPNTIGVGLDDSPAALAAWTLEKFSSATNSEYKKMSDGGLREAFTFDELIDNLMLYWINKSATTAARFYAECFHVEGMSYDRIPTRVPTAIARFPHEVVFQTEWQLREKYLNIVQISDFSEGGHFAALEVPILLADDIKSAVHKFIVFHMERNGI